MKPNYKKTEVGLLPAEWDVLPITSVLQKGSRITYGVVKPGPTRDDGVLFIRGGDIFDGKILTEQLRTISKEVSNQYKRTCLSGGEIVISLVGYPGEVALVPQSLAGANIARQVAVVRLDSTQKISGDYVCKFLQSPQGRRLLLKESIGSAQQVINLRDITRVVLVLPTEPEQRAIAQALSDVDALIATLDRLINKKRDIKQATMQQLLTGKTRLPGFSGKWETKRLTDMADIIKGNTLSKSLLSESGINPCILYGELFTTYGRVITKTVSFTNSPEGIKSLSGDVLLPGSTTTTGADLATASALLLDGVALGGDINIVRQKGIGYDPAFLACYLTHVARNEIAELAQGTTIHHLYGKDLKGLSLSLPHHTEQSAIASVISDMDTELTAMEARRDKTRAIKQGMMQELLTGKTRLI